MWLWLNHSLTLFLIFQTIKKLSDELALEKNEQKRIREVMARNTPKKSNSSLEQEVQTLKEAKAGQCLL